jgi:enamine deaminase RidA (YjgF/YER057c/UK114 family)
MIVERRLKELNLVLPEIGPALGNYVPAKRVGDFLYLSGRGPGKVAGKVGEVFTTKDGYNYARMVGLQLIAVMKLELGDLDRVKDIVKVLGMVNAVPHFTDHPEVINGCSDLFVEVFGERGRHARSAVGMGSLPHQIPVEIEAIVSVG